MKYLFLFLLVFTSGAAVATEPGSQYQQQAEAGDRRAQYYLADTWVSSGDYEKAEYWAQKAAAQGDGDALALLPPGKIPGGANAYRGYSVVRFGSPEKAKCAASGENPRYRYRLPGLQRCAIW